MQVVLLERVEKLGQMGDVVKVKPGYARNFLLPKKKAIRATKANLSHFETQRVQLEAVNLKRREDAQHVADKMNDVFVTLIRQASESGQLYGSVRSNDISSVLCEAGYTVNRTQVSVYSPIKTIGTHKAKVSLHPEVSIDVTLVISRSAEQAEVALAAAKQETAVPAPAAE